MASLLNALLVLLGSPSSCFVPQPDRAVVQSQQQQSTSPPAAAAANNLNHLERRNFVWTETHDSPQNLCGDSTFAAVSSSGDDGGGAAAADCRELVFYAASRPGFWLVTNFGAGGLSWVEFDVLGACKMAVRHADGGGGTIPIGNTDVIDLINSTIAMFSSGEGDNLPQVQGSMTCLQTSTAEVEWKLYGE